jgi:hypothetical protein
MAGVRPADNRFKLIGRGPTLQCCTAPRKADGAMLSPGNPTEIWPAYEVLYGFSVRFFAEWPYNSGRQAGIGWVALCRRHTGELTLDGAVPALVPINSRNAIFLPSEKGGPHLTPVDGCPPGDYNGNCQVISPPGETRWAQRPICAHTDRDRRRVGRTA